MVLKRFIALTLVLSLATSITHPVYSQTGGQQQQGVVPQLSFPPVSLPQNGGKLGVEVDPKAFYAEGRTFLKVLNVLPRSELLGQVKPGDFIFNINGYDVGSADDLFRVVRSGSPGTSVWVSYLNASLGFRPVTINARLYGADATPDSNAGRAASPSQGGNESFCTKNPATCVAGVIISAALIKLLLSGGGSGSTGPRERSWCSDPYYENGWGACKCGDPRRC